jgi:hypothetical protein
MSRVELALSEKQRIAEREEDRRKRRADRKKHDADMVKVEERRNEDLTIATKNLEFAKHSRIIGYGGIMLAALALVVSMCK